MRTRQRSESIEKKALDFGAYAAILPSQSQRMSGEPSIRRDVEPLKVGRRNARATHPQFRVIDHSGVLATGLLDTSGRATHARATRPIRAILKRVLDVVGAVLLGLLFAPLIVAIAILLRREGRSIIFRHRRVGRDGKAFDCLKFRSMVPDADRTLRDLLERHPELKAEWLRDHKLRDDPRITGVGRFLRRTSLDELPQLWNVLRGEMSLVGPRPVVREELLRYGRCACIYLSARPGITGLWQVKGRTNTDYRQRVVLDVYYVRRHNLFLDLYILMKTTHVVLGGSGAY